MSLESTRRSKNSISSKITPRIGGSNVLSSAIRAKEDPPEAIIHGLEPLIDCFVRKDANCFWDNFWWLAFRNLYHTCDLVSPFSPDPTCNEYPIGSEERERCESRKISSGYCYIADNWLNNWAKNENIGERDWCINIPEEKILQTCNPECSKLIGSDGLPMKLEAAGCDGYTIWCWCNIEEFSGGGFSTGDGHLE